MLVRLCYWSVRRVLGLLALRRRSSFERDVELVVLRLENMVLRRQIARPENNNADRAVSQQCRAGTGPASRMR